MTTAVSSQARSGDEPVPPLLTRGGWVWAALIGAGFVALFFNFIWRMGTIAMGRWGGDWSHAVVIPLISLYYIHLQHDKLAATPRRACGWGLPIFFAGLFSYAWWIEPGRNDMLQGYSMILALFGLILFLFGPTMMKILWFPVVFLVFGVKVADRFWDMIAAKLQSVAANSSAVMLNLLSFDASVRGTTIDLYHGTQDLGALNIAEACSGLRMLMAFMALGVAMAFLFERPRWQRLIMVLLTVPVAVAVNVGRVTTLGVLRYVSPGAAEGDFHKFVGLLMLIPALLVYMFLGWVLDHIIIYDEASRAVRRPATGGAAVAAKPFNWPLVAQGLGVGAVLTLIAGMAYALIWASLRNEIFGGWLSQTAARVVLAVAVAGLAAWSVVIWKLLRRERKREAAEPASGTRVSGLPLGLAAGLLLTASCGFWGVLKANGQVLHKEPIALQKQLYTIPDRMGNWVKVKEDKPLDSSMLEELGTTNYISRNYREGGADNPNGTEVHLHIAYYTGTPDTVPHVPERCYTAGGATAIDKITVPLTLSGPLFTQGPDGWASTVDGKTVHIPAMQFGATDFTFANAGHPDRPSNVIYFFAANGRYLSNPDSVRLHGFDPRDTYSYYCKIEMNFAEVPTTDEAIKQASKFLSAALPDIMSCLPDWVDVTQGKYPPKH